MGKSSTAYSSKEIMHLLEMRSMVDDELNDIFLSEKMPVATRMLYFRLLAKMCDTSDGTIRWILKPENGTTRTESIKKWMEDSTYSGIGSMDLLKFFAASSFRTALQVLIKTELLHIDKFNRMTLSYPFQGKMLSPVYAAKAIKSSYRKPTSLDKPDETGVQSEPESIKPTVSVLDEVGDFSDNYWENEEESK